jgi:prolyl-tRNA synthetase
MKDLYSFHADDEDFESYYSKVAEAYDKIFRRCGLKAIYTLAAGGVFTKSNTHEFQVISDVGEDTIFVCSSCEYSENKEISGLKDGDWCPRCKGKVQEKHAIEVGNIFSLGTKYSEALDLWFIDKNGSKKYVIMGSYGIGLGRVMGTVVEVHHDERGVMWPEEIAPFTVHMISLGEKAKKEAQKIYENLLAKGVEVLYDDRDDKTPGEKFADADLIGIPWRVVVSEKTILAGGIEIKSRSASKTEILTPELLFRKLKLKMQKSK